MTRIALVAALTMVVCSSLSSAAVAGEAQQPVLGVAGKRPFVVQGTGFEPRERVHVLLVLNRKQHWERSVTTRAGSFRVSFAVSLGRCSRYTVRAIGALGSRAVLLPLRARPNCEPPSAATT